MHPLTWKPIQQDQCPLTVTQLHLIRACLMYGMNTEVLASVLDLSPHTVDTHFKRINRRLDQTSRGDSVLLALRKGWVTLAQ